MYRSKRDDGSVMRWECGFLYHIERRRTKNSYPCRAHLTILSILIDIQEVHYCKFNRSRAEELLLHGMHMCVYAWVSVDFECGRHS